MRFSYQRSSASPSPEKKTMWRKEGGKEKKGKWRESARHYRIWVCGSFNKRKNADRFNSIGWVKSVEPLNRTHFDDEIEWAGWTLIAGREFKRHALSMVLYSMNDKIKNKKQQQRLSMVSQILNSKECVNPHRLRLQVMDFSYNRCSQM